MDPRVRNFCIIAHIDHGKSTLADRFLEITGTVRKEEMVDQILDNMDLERERGITIKSHPIQMQYHGYKLNLIDTPGHVDFNYEVSRSLAACEGAILLVDATQGVEAQTVTNAYLAIENDLVIIPVINKIDLPGAEVEQVTKQIVDLIGCTEDEILLVSAKTGKGVVKLLEEVIKRVPPPEIKKDSPLRALIFDSTFDSFRGAIPYVRVFEGEVRPGDVIKLFSHESEYEVSEVGIFRLGRVKVDKLGSGDVGYLIAGIKEITKVRVGDTITGKKNPASEPLPGYREIKPMVFSGLYPVNSEDYDDLRSALEKMKLNDSAIIFEPETSAALGFGFRVGYLGLLHMEVVQERLEREFNLELVTTMPNVKYVAVLKTGEEVEIDNPGKMPPQAEIDYLKEPYIRAEMITPTEYIGNIIQLCKDKRGIYKSTHYLDPKKVLIVFELPLAEVIVDFYDRLKSISRGYASFDYEHIGFRRGELVKLDILIAGESVDALSVITHRDKAYYQGRELCRKLKELIPRQLFEVAIQAAIGNKVIARETIKPLRKNVTAKCYGGDITRKKKLLEKQKEGKKRLKQIGRVEVPQEAFFALLKVGK
ncbi:MAG: translation elongation factor 4 [Candidatus Marinimicrobia bacterium]|nr:translation elongation factor 4 [Candidatus Neomarinimicrobiota bacterium]